MDWVYCRQCPRHEHRGLLISMGFAGKTKSRRADSNRLPLLQLRVIGQALQGFAQECKSRISKPLSFPWFALCCTVLRSRWYQSGVKRLCRANKTPSDYLRAVRTSRILMGNSLELDGGP